MSTLIPARNSFGSVFKYSSSTGGTLKTCANVISITPPSFSRGTVDVTNYGTTDYFELSIAGGPKRAGNVGIKAVFLTTASEQTVAIPADFQAGTVCSWGITMPGSSAYNMWTGDGIITGYNITGLNAEGMIGFDMAIQITGKPLLGSTVSI